MKSLRALLCAAALFCVSLQPTLAQAQPPAGPAALVQGAATGGGAWAFAFPDQYFVSPSSIVSATTTLLITGGTTVAPYQQAIYLFFAGVQATGTNSTNTFNFEYGQGSTCQTNTVVLEPVALTAPTASPNLSVEFGGANTQNAVGAISVSDWALIIPPGYNVCIVTAGTTTSLKAIVAYALH